MKIAILSRKKSLYSTNSLIKAGQARGHDVVVINHTTCSLVMEKGKPTIYYHGQPLEDIDAIIPRIGASVTMFGTAIVRQFEIKKIITTASAQAIELSRDKLKSQQLFSMMNIGIPKTVFAKFPKQEEVPNLISHVGGAPLIIKLLEGTQGLGVVLAETKSAAKSVIEGFSALKANILIQEFIKEAGGADLRVIVVNGRVVAAMKRQGAEGEFRSNLHQGGSAQALQLNKKEAHVAIKAAKAMGLGVAGVDMLVSKRGPLIMEVNSSPGLEGIEKTTGIDVAGKIIEYLELKQTKKEARKKRKLDSSKPTTIETYQDFVDIVNPSTEIIEV
ncbi:MAG: 30S ribosomal protein S6--L-glutamate ligase [Cyanobacteria bacterium]|nr:30S ribosomal protein S6--L-glutamate ligase [Cyanobacteriota bacterium]MDA1020327.1 30S ribosomal protein S6--L-glutamate ligase [Cyanobacteriota bacterium]